jgi:transposase
MYSVNIYRRVRLACHRDGMSGHEAARQSGLGRKTVSKILKYSVPPGYRRSVRVRRPKLDGFTDIIDRILEDDRTVHRKQRLMAKRIFVRLRDEHGFTGKQTLLKDYVRERGRRQREMFVLF